MARPLRLPVAGGIYHVTARGNAKQPIYLDDRDCETFLRTLNHVRVRFGWRCLAYCLMVNHYHLVVETPQPNLSDGMRQLNGTFTQRFHRRHGRGGHLFQGRFHSVLVDRDQHLLELARYVARNPVRAGLCRRPEEWRWSSHCALAGLAPARFIAIEGLLSYFGANPAVARRRYLAFVHDADGDESGGQGTDVILGDETFRAAHLPEQRPSPEVGPWAPPRPQLAEIVARFERDEAIARAFRVHGYRMHEIATALGCHYSTVSRRLKAWEVRQMQECKT
jgi:putative transposase